MGLTPIGLSREISSVRRNCGIGWGRWKRGMAEGEYWVASEDGCSGGGRSDRWASAGIRSSCCSAQTETKVGQRPRR